MSRLRNKDIVNCNTQKAILSLDSAFKAAVMHSALKPGSGLVEMQKILHKKRK